MYTCEKCISLLMAFLDGDLSAEEHAHLEKHLGACPPCVDFLNTYRATPGLCRKALARKMPEEMSARLTEYLRAKMKTPP